MLHYALVQVPMLTIYDSTCYLALPCLYRTLPYLCLLAFAQGTKDTAATPFKVMYSTVR
jgi:hypothetical protein